MRLFKMIVLLCVALACVLVGASPKAREAFGSIEGDALIPIEISARWQLGSRYVLRTDLDQDASVPSLTLPWPSIQHVRLGQDFMILVLPARFDGSRDLQIDFTAETLGLVKDNRVVIDFASRRPPREDFGNGAAGMLRRLAASNLRVRVDPTGRTREVEDYSGFMDRITADYPWQYQFLMRDTFSEDGFAQMIPNQGLPNKKVKVGDTWVLRSMIIMPSHGISLPIELNYVFRRWEEIGNRKFARLEFNGTLSEKYDYLGIDNLRLVGHAWYDPMMGTVVESIARAICNLHETLDGVKIPSLIVQTASQKLLAIVPPDAAPNNPR